MRAFVSYRHTGAQAEDINQLLEAVRSGLAARSVGMRSTFFDVRGGQGGEHSLGPAGFMLEAFKMMDVSDFLLVLQESEARSEGMLIEVGYAIAKGQPVVVATKAGVANTYLPQMATSWFEWRDYRDLEEKLRSFEFDQLRHGNMKASV